MTFIKAIYILGGLLLILLSIPLILRRIPPNAVYGFRIQWTRRNPELWYSVNAHAGKWLAFAGSCSLLGSIGLSLIPGISLAVYAFACLAILAAAVVLAVVQSIRFLRLMDDQL
jgi:uncharacterized membrane protein